MKYSRVVLLEALVPGDHAVQQLSVQGEGGNSRQKPAVTCVGSRGTHTRQARPAGSLLSLIHWPVQSRVI